MSFEQGPCILGHVTQGHGPEPTPGQGRSREKPQHKGDSHLEVWLCPHWRQYIPPEFLSRPATGAGGFPSASEVAGIVEKYIGKSLRGGGLFQNLEHGEQRLLVFRGVETLNALSQSLQPLPEECCFTDPEATFHTDEVSFLAKNMWEFGVLAI